MSVAQTLHSKENEAPASGHALARAIEAIEETPPETEEFLSRAHSVNDLLETLANEEVRQGERRARHDKIFKYVFRSQLVLGCLALFLLTFPPSFVAPETSKTLGKGLCWLCVGLLGVVNHLNAKQTGHTVFDVLSLSDDNNKHKRTPHFSSRLQQNAITALLNYTDDPRVADPLCRAIVYYDGDSNLLYLRLARVLPLLINNTNTLSERSRRILFNVMQGYTDGLLGGNDQRQTLPVLQAAAKEYFARTGAPAPRPKRKWFRAKQSAPQITKENG